MNYKPSQLRAIQNYLIVKLDKWVNKTESGFFIPDSEETCPVTGEIISIGHRVKKEYGFKVGQRVRCEQYKGLIFWINDDYREKYVNIKDHDIDWIIEE